MNFDSIYPIWGTFGSSPIFTILPNFHHIVDRINTFFWNNGQQNHQKRPNLKKRLFWSLKSYNLSKKIEFWWCLSNSMAFFFKMTFWSLFWSICNKIAQKLLRFKFFKQIFKNKTLMILKLCNFLKFVWFLVILRPILSGNKFTLHENTAK